MTHFPPSDNDWIHDPLVPDAHRRAWTEIQRRWFVDGTKQFPKEQDAMDGKIEAAKALAKVYGIVVIKAIYVGEEDGVYIRTIENNETVVYSIYFPPRGTAETRLHAYMTQLETLDVDDALTLSKAGFFA